MSVVDSIYDTGDDALTSQFDISFSFADALISQLNEFLDSALSSNFTLRTVAFNIPEFGVNTNEIKYEGYTIKKPNGSTSQPYEFSFDIRVDKYWDIYKFFSIWINLVLKQRSKLLTTDKVLGLLPTLRVPIIVTSTKNTWTFLDCFPISMSGVSLNLTENSPVTITITFCYGAMQII